MIKIAFVINFSNKTWNGGYNFFENLIFFLKKYKKKVNIVIITDQQKNIIKKNFKNIEIIETSLVSNKFNLRRFLDKILIILFGKSFFFENFLIKNNIEVLSHNTFCGKHSKIKSFPWFPDFQHLHFPENFSIKNKILRNFNVLLASQHSNNIILSSKSVRNDIKKISVKAYEKSKVLYHTNRIINLKNINNLKYLKKKFKIKKNFFLLPNHYWIHKNHLIVLKALREIKKPNFEILSTGMLLDHRDRNHIKKIQKYIKDNKLDKFYKILDLVSFADFCSLMKYSIGVINPSMSEGWPNSADQARILGKPCILSNIPVHLEFNYKYVNYFNPKDHKKLAKLLLIMSKKKLTVTSKKNNFNEIKYINDYLKIILN